MKAKNKKKVMKILKNYVKKSKLYYGYGAYQIKILDLPLYLKWYAVYIVDSKEYTTLFY